MATHGNSTVSAISASLQCRGPNDVLADMPVLVAPPLTPHWPYVGTDLLLHVEPSNMQAQSLRSLIDRAETREGYIGEPCLVLHCSSQRNE
jgi:hypothetical protein